MYGLALQYKLKQTKFVQVGNDKGQAVLQIEAPELPVNSEDLSKVKTSYNY